MTSTAAVSSVHQSENLLIFILLQLIVIIIAARTAGDLARRFGQPRAVGEIIAGLALGPSLLGFYFPELSSFVFHTASSLPISVISQIGLIFLMFQIGMDFDFSHLTENRNRKAVVLVGITCIVLPFSLGFVLGQLSNPYLAPGIPVLPYSLFIGTALSITAVPILGRIMMEFGLTRTRVGAITISAAAINDVVGWLMLAVISAVSVAQFSPTATAIQIGLLALYVTACWWLVKPLLKILIRSFNLKQGQLPQNLLATLLVLIFLSSMATAGMGLFAILGGFVLGVLVHEHQEFVALWKKSVGDFVIVFFLPVFFTYTGLRTDIHGLDTLPLWMWCLGFIFAATFGKFGGAYVGARMAGFNPSESSTIGIMMNTRALMELIVLNIGYDLGFIPQNVFTMLVIMAVFSTAITGPVLRRLLFRIGHSIPRGVDA